MHDEELTAVGIGTGVCHCEDTALVTGLIEIGGCIDLVIKFISRSALPPAPLRCVVFGKRIAPLNHKILDHAMELCPVVKFSLGELDEICHSERRFFRKELHLNITEIGYEDRLGILQIIRRNVSCYLSLFIICIVHKKQNYRYCY